MADRFEGSVKRLEKIVERMEKGDLSLDDSLKYFEEGIKLARLCHEELNAAQKKVEILTRDGEGKMNPVPFEMDGEIE